MQTCFDPVFCSDEVIASSQGNGESVDVLGECSFVCIYSLF
jgi:hypothetical protein